MKMVQTQQAFKTKVGYSDIQVIILIYFYNNNNLIGVFSILDKDVWSQSSANFEDDYSGDFSSYGNYWTAVGTDGTGQIVIVGECNSWNSGGKLFVSYDGQ